MSFVANTSAAPSTRTASVRSPRGRTVKVGQYWAVGPMVYRVESLRGRDPQYPIVMFEAHRAESVNDEIRGQAEALGPVLGADCLRMLEPRTMTVEARWFDRKDVVRVNEKERQERFRALLIARLGMAPEDTSAPADERYCATTGELCRWVSDDHGHAEWLRLRDESWAWASTPKAKRGR